MTTAHKIGWIAGIRTCYDNERRSCPFPAGTTENDQWCDGHDEALETYQARIKEKQEEEDREIWASSICGSCNESILDCRCHRSTRKHHHHEIF